MQTLIIAAILIVVMVVVLDVVYGTIFDARAAARSMLHHQYEARLIDAEGLARGLRAIDAMDEAA